MISKHRWQLKRSSGANGLLHLRVISLQRHGRHAVVSHAPCPRKISMPYSLPSISQQQPLALSTMKLLQQSFWLWIWISRPRNQHVPQLLQQPPSSSNSKSSLVKRSRLKTLKPKRHGLLLWLLHRLGLRSRLLHLPCNTATLNLDPAKRLKTHKLTKQHGTAFSGFSSTICTWGLGSFDFSATWHICNIAATLQHSILDQLKDWKLTKQNGTAFSSGFSSTTEFSGGFSSTWHICNIAATLQHSILNQLKDWKLTKQNGTAFSSGFSSTTEFSGGFSSTWHICNIAATLQHSILNQLKDWKLTKQNGTAFSSGFSSTTEFSGGFSSTWHICNIAATLQHSILNQLKNWKLTNQNGTAFSSGFSSTTEFSCGFSSTWHKNATLQHSI